ncbi:MAG: LytTR family DNA-binding domain-containing protein [Bacteroidia bacterium]|nr:LytTR family DNA-binding domain-containing protein [Bacteroidia bacterium]
MPKFNCIVIDDDPFVTTILKNFCDKCEVVNCVGKFSNGAEALRFLKENNDIDIIFLDVEMPVMNGIDFMKCVRHTGAQVVVCSSKPDYAVETYEYDVCDYLMKPIKYERFLRSVEKVALERDKIKKWISVSSGEYVKASDDIQDVEDVWIKDTMGHALKVKVEEVVYIEAMENYMSLHTVSKQHTVHMTMKAIIDLFSATTDIMRIHKSYAVNIRNVSSIQDGNVIIQTMGNRVQIPIGRTYMKDLRERINKLPKS